MKIAQISDVHIRSLSRHGEYRLVFDELTEKLKKQRPDHIINTGDTFHTKTSGITGEYINLCRQWFEELAEIAPLHIVLGNHDFSMANLSREDAVSPIVKAMNNPKISFYKKSGVYQFAPGYNFCVFSIFDEEGWKNVKPVSGEVNIAVFHGPVAGSKTETNWELSSDLKVSDFVDFDAAMLGDIHKTQFLGYREYEFEIDEDDLSKYPNAVLVV